MSGKEKLVKLVYKSNQKRFGNSGHLEKGKIIEVSEKQAKILLKQKIGRDHLWELAKIEKPEPVRKQEEVI